MKILYITRHCNRSGYYILQELIRRRYHIIGVVVKKEWNPLRIFFFRLFSILAYYGKCWFYRCRPVRFLKSEECMARRNRIPLFKIDDIKTDLLYSLLQSLSPDIIVLGGGWHQLLPPRVYRFPRYGTINTHPSLLPLFRGTTVHRWQILHGVSESGVSIHYVDESFDTGSIIAQKKVEIQETDTPQDLFEKTARISGPLMCEVLDRIGRSPDDRIESFDQRPGEEHYFKKWQWEESFLTVNWCRTFRDIHRLILACTQESYEYKGPIIVLGGKRYFLRKAMIAKNGRYRQGGDNSILLLQIDSFGLHLFRESDEHLLILNQIQWYDAYFRYRRAFNPSRMARKQRWKPGISLDFMMGGKNGER